GPAPVPRSPSSPRTPRAGTLAHPRGRADSQALLRREDPLDDEVVFPLVAEVVRVDEGAPRPSSDHTQAGATGVEVGEGHQVDFGAGLGDRGAEPFELIEVVVLPAHRCLEN